MPDLNKSTRLGDILVDRGIITRQQLREAIEIQQARRFLSDKEGIDTQAQTAIGEILVELGFINRKQLVKTLGWQVRLRKATLVMSFVAPLLTAACGGGGGGATSNQNTNNKTDESSTSSLQVKQQSSSQAPQFSSSNSSASSISSSTPSQPVASSSSLSQASSSTISQSSASSQHSSMSSKHSSAAGSNITGIDGPVLMKWSVPSKRENGEQLEPNEIGGYELRYKPSNGVDYTTVVIDGGHVDSYYFNHLEGDLEFEIAAYDTNGLYSRFVPIQPQPE